MSKNNICEKVSSMLKTFLEDKDIEIYNIKYVKEGKDKFLRVFIDKCKENEYVSTSDCELVSRYLSERLDSDDIISDNYFLEVSSPGMDRELVRDEHFDKYSGKDVNVKLYKSIDGLKDIQGKLIGIVEGKIVIEDKNGKELSFPKEQVAIVKLSINF